MYFIVTCQDSALRQIIGVVKNFLNILMIVSPILLILILSITITKIVINPEEKKLLSKIKNSVFALLLIFFIPIIVNAVMLMLDDSTNLSSCWNNDVKISNVSSTYLEPTEVDPPKNIITNSSEYEEYTEPETNSASVEELLKAAKEVTDYVRVNNFKYGNAPLNPAIDHSAKLVSCDRCVGWFLYKIGYTDQPKANGLVVYDASGAKDLPKFLEKNNFKKITNKNDLKAGDIVFVNPKGSVGYPGHTFLLGNKVSNGVWERYDCGSDTRLRSVQPFKEGINNFMYAYRMPSNN